LSLKILADEDVNFRIIEALRELNFDVISISENNKGISDFEVIKLCRRHNSVLLTEDSDFGEWVFAHKEKNIGIIFLRYKIQDLKEIITSLTAVLNNYKENIQRKFIVINKNKIRVRDIAESES
jgi:predicted nuclease of predicted toxin-antitoxin system